MWPILETMSRKILTSLHHLSPVLTYIDQDLIYTRQTILALKPYIVMYGVIFTIPMMATLVSSNLVSSSTILFSVAASSSTTCYAPNQLGRNKAIDSGHSGSSVQCLSISKPHQGSLHSSLPIRWVCTLISSRMGLKFSPLTHVREEPPHRSLLTTSPLALYLLRVSHKALLAKRWTC